MQCTKATQTEGSRELLVLLSLNNNNNNNIPRRKMGLSHEIREQMSYYPTLTIEEKARMHPCKKAKCVMMSGDSSPTLQASIQSPNYVELPDEPRPGKITPSTHTTNSTPSPRTSKSDNGPNGSNSTSPEVEEAIEEAVPIVRTTLPSPEPRPLIERNGYKEHDRVDGIPLNNKQKPKEHDVDDDSCLIKCVYFTQQCCECTIV